MRPDGYSSSAPTHPAGCLGGDIDERTEPARCFGVHVVVEKQQNLAAACGSSTVDEGRKIEGARIGDRAYARIGAQLVQQRQLRAILRAIVDNDQLEVGQRLIEHGADSLPQEARIVPRRHDDGYGWAPGGHHVSSRHCWRQQSWIRIARLMAKYTRHMPYRIRSAFDTSQRVEQPRACNHRGVRACGQLLQSRSNPERNR